MEAAPATTGGSSIWPELRRSVPGLVLLLACAALVLLGLLVLFSAGMGDPGQASVYMRKQAVFACLGVCAMLAAWRIDLEWLRKLAWPIAVVSVCLLASVLVPGVAREINGARRWLDFGPVNLQVSDPAKIGLLIVMAHYLANNQRHITELRRGYILPLAIVGLPFCMIILQPDFGTAALCGAVGGTMIFLAGARMVYLIPTALAGISLFGIAVYLDPVRLGRVLSFLDVEANKADGAYQLWQGILAFGVGGVEGVGLGNGRQQMAFLPEAHTDFIFAIIGEELGLLWTVTVVAIFLLILCMTVSRLRNAPNLYQFLVVTGALLFITLQALINFGVVTGCLPTKGMSLPFISYGGSNLIATCTLVGLILNGMSHWGRVPKLKPREVF